MNKQTNKQTKNKQTNTKHHVECIHLPDCCTGHRKVSLFVYQWIWVCTMSILSDAPEQPKGQLISKRNSQAEDSPKNEQMNSFLLVCDVFSFVFWANLRPEKNCFEIIWPLADWHFTRLDWQKFNLEKNLSSESSRVKFKSGIHWTHLSFHCFISNEFRVLVDYFWRSIVMANIMLSASIYLTVVLGIKRWVYFPFINKFGFAHKQSITNYNAP